jgi:hypothetical protein
VGISVSDFSPLSFAGNLCDRRLPRARPFARAQIFIPARVTG